MNKALKIFRSIRKELKQFDDLFDNYVQELEFSKYLADTKGKMLRPASTILAAKIAGKVTDATLWAAVSVEMMHNATLVHDDVVDDADKRRDKPTFRALNGDRRAVLYGDYLFAKSLNSVVRTGNLKIINAIATTTGEMSVGEIQQMDFSGTFSTAEKDYYDIIYKKTASLFICSLLVGYYSSSDDNQWEETIRSIGFNLGMAFQVKDDLLDYDTNNKSGKTLGNDIKEQKMTLPLIHAFANESEERVSEIKKMINLPSISDKQIIEVVTFAHQSGGISYTEDILNNFIVKSKQAINSLPKSDSQKALSMLCDYLVKREK